MTTASNQTKTQRNAHNRHAFAWWGLLPITVIMVTGALLSWHSLGDLDIWFHLRSGRDLLDGQGITSANRYSFTEPDHPWVNHEWLFQVLTALTGPESIAGSGGAVDPDVDRWNLMRSLLSILLLMVIIAGDRGIARFLGKDGPTSAAWAGVPLCMGLLLLWPRLTLRPELFSYIFFVLLIRWAEQVFRTGSPLDPSLSGSGGSTRRSWLSLLDPRLPAGRIVLLTVIWAQFHGFVSVVPLVVFLAGLLAMFQNRWMSAPGTRSPGALPLSQAAGLVLLTVAALALTPNGWNGLMMPVRALGQFSQAKVDLRTTISELVPLQDSPNSLALTINIYRASLVWGAFWILATFGRISLLRIAVFALAAWAAWTNQRSIGLYAVAFMLLHTGTPANPWRFAVPRLPVIGKVLAGLSVMLAFALVLWPRIVTDDFYLMEGVGRRFGTGLSPAHFPVKAAEVLRSSATDRYFANLDTAAFMLAHVPGRNYIDARTEAYSADLWAEYLAIKNGDEGSLKILADRQVAAVCLATGGGSFDRLASLLLASPSWDLWTAESGGLLFRPAGNHPATEDLERAAGKALADADNGSITRKADLCLAAGSLFKFAGNETSAAEAYRRGLSFRKDHPTLQHNLGNLLMNRQDLGEALPLFLGALEVNSRLGGSALNAGVCQMRLGRPGEAEKSFARATGIDPENFEAWANLAVARLGSADRDGARSALEKALEIRPGDRRLQNLLRDVKSGSGQ